MITCIVFDRDGTLGELVDKRYPHSLVPYCDIKKVFDNIKSKGYKVAIISNQASIARGTAIDYDFNAEFSSFGADAWAICPHDTNDNCSCRKPKSGLLLSVCEKLEICPSECIVVGDRLSDILCAVGVDAKAALVLTGYGETEKAEVISRYPSIPIITRFDKILDVL
jgi:HAD superfamily hydrolase (TIGR01662 family)